MWELTDFPDYPLSRGFFFSFSLKISAVPAVITDGRTSSTEKHPFSMHAFWGQNILKLPLQYQFLNHMDDINL